MKLLDIIERKVETYNGLIKEQSEILVKTIEIQNKYIFPPETIESENLELEYIYSDSFANDFKTGLENHKESENSLKFKVINFSEKHIQKLRNSRKLLKENILNIEKDLPEINQNFTSRNREIVDLTKECDEDNTDMVDSLNEALSINNELKDKKEGLEKKLNPLTRLLMMNKILKF